MITPDGTMTLPAGRSNLYPRGEGSLVTTPDGRVLAANVTAIVRLTPKSVQPILDLGSKPFDGISGFAPEGIAVSRNGAIYVDTWLGNGYTNKTAVVEIRPGGHVQLLWKS